MCIIMVKNQFELNNLYGHNEFVVQNLFAHRYILANIDCFTTSVPSRVGQPIF